MDGVNGQSRHDGEKLRRRRNAARALQAASVSERERVTVEGESWLSPREAGITRELRAPDHISHLAYSLEREKREEKKRARPFALSPSAREEREREGGYRPL